MTVINAKVDSVIPLTDSILQVLLNPVQYVPYQAGQYLQILCQKEALSYSIANAPLGSHKYELHIRHSRNNPASQALLKLIREQGQVTLRIPLGHCSIARLSPQKPIIFIARGTGFAPIKAMIEQLLADSDPRTFALYWLTRSQSDLYMPTLVQTWQTHVRAFRYFSLLSDNTENELVDLIKTKEIQGLQETQMVLCGSFDWAYTLRDVLISNGVPLENMYSDAFDFKKKE
jgi:CDP-4-dehydro-6-deoxyglucose reductase, E3